MYVTIKIIQGLRDSCYLLKDTCLVGVSTQLDLDTKINALISVHTDPT